MITDKCPMINDQGFALITVLFMLVSLISVVFMCAYLPISEKRDVAKEYITDMRDRKVKRAIFGRLADQRGGRFGSCGGLYSEDAPKHPAVGGRYARRIFTIRRQGNDLAPACEYTEPYKYNSDYGLWAGYRGKCYYYTLPSDESYDPYYHDAFGNKFNIATQCNLHEFIRYYFLRNWRMCMFFRHKHRYLIKVKDYTKTPDDSISLELVSASLGKTDNISQTMTKYLVTGERGLEYNFVPGSDTMLLPNEQTGEYAEYNLHTFLLDYIGNKSRGRKTSVTGLIKLIVRVKKDNNWVTTYTQPIIVPLRYRCKGPRRTVIDSYVQEIDYYG